MSAMASGRRTTRRHHHGARRHRALAPALALVAGALTAAPASAVPPTNDAIANAVAVGGLGFTATADTREATSDGNDPCGIAGTVWYVFQPTETSRVLIDTTDSGYDSSVAVLTGTLGNLSVRKCRDGSAFGINERFVLTMHAGATYYIAAGACCYGIEEDEDAPEVQVGPGGDLVLRLLKAPPEVTLRATVDSAPVATRLGSARVRGSVVCGARADAYVSVIIRQRQGERIVTAGRGRSVPCPTRPRTWKVVLQNDAYAFQPGVALVRYTVRACDGLTCDRERGRQVVRLRAG